MAKVSIARLPDWRGRLQSFIASAAARPFQPGRHDCALFAAGAVHAMTGVDLARGWRGYRSLEQGRRSLQKRGYEDQADLASAFFPVVPLAAAGPGDLAELIDPKGRCVLGVVQGARIYVLRPDGLGLVPLFAAKRAFRV